MRPVSFVVLTLLITCGVMKNARADPASPPPRSRWLMYSGVGTPVWRYVAGHHFGPWQQPTLLELIGVGYTLHRPWLEVRAAALFGQRLDLQSGNSAGVLASINLSVPPGNIGVAAVVLNTPVNGTNVGVGVTFAVGTRVGTSGLIVGLGGQIVTYPGLNWPITLVIAPSLVYRFPGS